MQSSNEDQTRDIGDIFKERGKLKKSCTEPVKRALVSNTFQLLSCSLVFFDVYML